MPYYGQKLAIKFKFYGKLVKMAKKCYHFLNVLFNPQILSHQKVKLVGESLRKYLIAALGGDPKVHSAPPPFEKNSYLSHIFFVEVFPYGDSAFYDGLVFCDGLVVGCGLVFDDGLVLCDGWYLVIHPCIW